MSRRIKTFIQKRAVLTYVALTFAISWTGAVVLLGPGAFPLQWERFERFGAAFYVVTLAGPCLASLLLTSFLEGRSGLRAMFARLGRWRVGAGWYGFALLPAVLLAAAQMALSLVYPGFVPAIFGSDDKAATVVLSITAALLFGCFEEIGWTGFAVPRLRAHHTVITTSLVLGVVWGAWHFLLFWETDTFSGALPLAILLIRLFSWLPAFRLLMVWVHDRTGSLPLVMLMHASVVFVQVMLLPQQLEENARMAAILVTPVVMWLFAAASLVGTPQLWWPRFFKLRRS
jgi:uncharacterized protein